MGYVIFGHGGLTPTGASKMETCALDPGTSIQFFADIGQELLQARTLLDMFGQLNRPWPPITSSGVTYNLQLSPFSQQERQALRSNVQDWGGHTLLSVGIDLDCAPQLCTGTPDTCPKDPRMVAGTVAGPRKHNCNGILTRYSGQELFWVACTATIGFNAQTQGVIDTARGDAPKQVLIGQDPDSAVATALKYAADYPAHFPAWFDQQPQHDRDVMLRDPGIYAWYQGRQGDQRTAQGQGGQPVTSGDLGMVQQENERYVKALDDETDASWEVGGGLVLLGDQHGDYHQWVQQQPDYSYGTFQVKRPMIGAGKMIFKDAPAVHQNTITDAVERFSDKSVRFE